MRLAPAISDFAALRSPCRLGIRIRRARRPDAHRYLRAKGLAIAMTALRPARPRFQSDPVVQKKWLP